MKAVITVSMFKYTLFITRFRSHSHKVFKKLLLQVTHTEIPILCFINLIFFTYFHWELGQ
jgi:hypothetical protein